MTPAYSAHLNADTATLIIRQTFQTFEYQYSCWFIDQTLKQNSLMQTLILRRLTRTYNVYEYQHQNVVRLLFLCIYNIILQLKQVSQPLKYEEEELYE